MESNLCHRSSNRDDWRHRAIEALGLVDTHVRQRVPFQEIESVGHVFFVEPSAVAKLDGELKVLQLLGDPLQIAEGSSGRVDVRRKLEEHDAELPCGMQRHEGVAECLGCLGL